MNRKNYVKPTIVVVTIPTDHLMQASPGSMDSQGLSVFRDDDSDYEIDNGDDVW